ncbi:MAG: TonB C-terminal domain-containing protein [Cyanobacteria bacterium HKST-UBA04]|nr:TonB C-terminal domain-containing protein [Cyanobacteria bacterium HKST-UBA04]
MMFSIVPMPRCTVRLCLALGLVGIGCAVALTTSLATTTMAKTTETTQATTLHASLTSVATFTDTNQPVNVLCPSDMAGGDLVTCAVITDAALNVELTSTKVFTDDSAPFTRVSFTVPSGVAKVPLQLTTSTGDPVATVEMPCASSATHTTVDHGTAGLLTGQPRVGDPLVAQGDFSGLPTNTTVTVNGQQAEVIASSPRQMVINNPVTQPGKLDVVIEQNGKVLVNQSVNSLPSQTGQLSESFVDKLKADQSKLATHTAPSSACQTQLASYRANLRQEVDAGWTPPRPDRDGEFRASFTFHVNADHSISNVKMTKSSGDSGVDTSAYQRLQAMTASNPLPACLTDAFLNVGQTFVVIAK